MRTVQKKKLKNIIIDRAIMKMKYQIQGISCGGCIARVKKNLESHPDIEKTEIFLNPKGRATITMKEKLSEEDIQRQLDRLEGYTITEII